MLVSLHVQNFAIIDEVNVDFAPGFTAITGEAGAGKSLIIDAINLLVGGRSSSNIVRNGAVKAVIEGVFDSYNNAVQLLLDEYGIDADADLIIRRDIYANGKSTFRINGFIASLSQVEMIGNNLIDIHQQNDTMRLFNPKNYLTFIDDDNIKILISKYQILYKNYNNCYKNFMDLKNQNQRNLENIDFLKFEYNEITKANLQVNELESLEQELKYLNNYETTYEDLNNSKEIIQEFDLRGQLYKLMENLKHLKALNPQYIAYYNDIENAYYNIEDLENTISTELNNFEFDEGRINFLNERISEINRLIKKYKRTVPELIEFSKELSVQIDNVDNADVNLENSKELLTNSYQKLCDIARQITSERRKNVLTLKENIIQTLKELMLSKVQIDIVLNSQKLNDCFDQTPFHKNGVDDVDILISFNLGEALKPLAKIASGGEMSRVMLALKTHLFKNKGLSTIIFDEIDTGMSGAVADAVAKKLQELISNTQVFAITHLPIVASSADSQIYVSKFISENTTNVVVKQLNYSERIDCIAEMISPNDLTGKTKEVAKLMITKK